MANNLGAIYPSTWTENDVITKGATVTLVAGQYTPVGEYTVKADEMVGIGRGPYGTQNEAIGRIYALFKDSSASGGATFEGRFRIMLLSSQEIPIGAKPVFLHVDLAALRTGKNIPADRFVLPFELLMLQKDKKFQFLIKVDGSTNVTLSKDNSEVLIDTSRVIV